jgi:hypothetical protein
VFESSPAHSARVTTRIGGAARSAPPRQHGGLSRWGNVLVATQDVVRVVARLQRLEARE